MVTQNTLAGLLNAGIYEFKIHRSDDGQFYWTLHSTVGNTEAVAISEMYTAKQSAHHSIQQIKSYAATARITDLT